MEITSGIYYVGILNPNLRVFDIVMTTQYGTSYNAYIVKGKEKTALIEASHQSFTKQFIENIKQYTPLADIDYVVLNHNEPDHTGSLNELLDYMPKAEIITSKAGSLYIQGICNRENMPIRVAKDGEVIDLGGKTLKFIMAPFLHWPDSMFTWVEEDKTLFSCDFLGSHYCEPYIMDNKIGYVSEYRSALKGYYDPIFGPFGNYVATGLSKIKDLDIQYVCTSHGPVLTKEGQLDYVLDMYNQWCKQDKNPVATVPIFFCSAYGHTRTLAIAIAEGVRSVCGDCNVKTYDIIEHDMEELSNILNKSDGFGIGTPTLNRDAVAPVWQLLSHLDAINNAQKSAVVFGSYGWSGEGVPNVVSRLRGIKINVIDSGYKVSFVPSDEDIERAKLLGEELGKAVLSSYNK